MPLFPPEWPTRLVTTLKRMIASIRGLAPFLDLLEGEDRTAPSRGEIDKGKAGQAELLTLVLYWFYEYEERRISPSELLLVLTNLLNTQRKEL